VSGDGSAVPRGGEPLDEKLRGRFEAWFHFDFSQIRIHADGAAARAADTLRARAFTRGRDIVFANGAYRPDSDGSQRLVAHELAHVVQQSGASHDGPADGGLEHEERAAREAAAAWERSARAPAQPAARFAGVRRQPVDAGVPQDAPHDASVGTPAPGGAPPQSACGTAAWNQLTSDFPQAARWLTTAEAAVRRFAAKPSGDPANAAALDAIRTHFHRTDASIAGSVADALHRVLGAVSGGPGGDVRCEVATVEPCASGADAAAQRATGQVVFCPFYFTEGPSARINSLVHEYAHLNAVANRYLEDRAHGLRRQYRFLSPEEAFDNAASFANLVEDLGTGSAASLAREKNPQDVVAGCDQTMTGRALAIVEGWNLAAFTVLSQPAAVAQARTQTLLGTHLGNTSAATVGKAFTAFSKVGSAVEKPMDLACEARATGGCAGGAEWYVDPPNQQHPAIRWHLCPTWKNLGGDEDRAASVFRALLRHQAALAPADLAGHVAFARAVAPIIALPAPPPIPAPVTTPAAPPATGTPPAAPTAPPGATPPHTP
jgi:hypothetical protein